MALGEEPVWEFEESAMGTYYSRTGNAYDLHYDTDRKKILVTYEGSLPSSTIDERSLKEGEAVVQETFDTPFNIKIINDLTRLYISWYADEEGAHSVEYFREFSRKSLMQQESYRMNNIELEPIDMHDLCKEIKDSM